MEEIEVPLEQTQEEVHHAATHSQEKWITFSALLSAFLAVFAAIAALMAGATSNEALIEQMNASDTWSHYQAKSIKASIQDLAQTEASKEKSAEYHKEMEELSEKAKELETHSKHQLAKHETLATSVTFFQIAIAMTAIAVLSRRKKFLGVSSLLGVVGLIILILGFLK
jgi:heme/copper-type cytochrome/quinol oxidase subunit 4